MGMFDYVDYEMKCPECGHKVKDFQTKDTSCTMGTVKPHQTIHFYASCPNEKCRAWIDCHTMIPIDVKIKVTVTKIVE